TSDRTRIVVFSFMAVGLHWMAPIITQVVPGDSPAGGVRGLPARFAGMARRESYLPFLSRRNSGYDALICTGRRFGRFLCFGGRRFRCGHHGFWLPETRIGLDPFVVWIAHFWTEPNQSCAVACNRRLQKFPPSLLPLHAERILECFSRAHRSVKIAKRFSGRKNVDRPVRSAVPPLEEDVV